MEDAAHIHICQQKNMNSDSFVCNTSLGCRKLTWDGALDVVWWPLTRHLVVFMGKNRWINGEDRNAREIKLVVH